MVYLYIMEKLTPGGEYTLLESQILTKNADYLQELVERSSYTLTEHIRRAGTFYKLSMDMFENGGDVHSVSADGPEVIPLFDQPANDLDVRINLSIKKVNEATADAFKKLGINDSNPDTHVMDNVINHYYQATIRSWDGHKIIIENAQGVKQELLFL